MKLLCQVFSAYMLLLENSGLTGALLWTSSDEISKDLSSKPLPKYRSYILLINIRDGEPIEYLHSARLLSNLLPRFFLPQCSRLLICDEHKVVR